MIDGMLPRWAMAIACGALLCATTRAAPPPAQQVVTSFPTAPEGPGAKAPVASAGNAELEQVIAQLTREAESQESIVTQETIKMLGRPHPAVAGLKQTSPAQIA